MAFEVTIRGKKSLFKKAAKVDINQIVDKLGFNKGRYNEAYVLKEDDVPADAYVIYNPNRIGRGLFVNARRLEVDNEVTLTCLLPTTQTEIEDFFKLAEEIVNGFGKVTIYSSEKAIPTLVFFSYKEDLIRTSLETLNENASTDKHPKRWVVPVAKFPYEFSNEERQLLAKTTTLDVFEQRLHDIQCGDVYYASPAVYREQEKDVNFAIYTLTEECEGVFPLEGKDSLVTVTLETEIDEAWINFYIFSEERVLDGLFNYAKWIELVQEKSPEHFDATHIIVPSFTKNELIGMANTLRENGYVKN